jgi:hypothetical protein
VFPPVRGGNVQISPIFRDFALQMLPPSGILKGLLISLFPSRTPYAVGDV